MGSFSTIKHSNLSKERREYFMEKTSTPKILSIKHISLNQYISSNACGGGSNACGGK